MCRPGRRRSRRWRRRRSRGEPQHVVPLEANRHFDPQRAGRLHPEARGKLPLEPANRLESRRRISRLVQAVGEPVQHLVAPGFLRIGRCRAKLLDGAAPLLLGDVVFGARKPLGFQNPGMSRDRQGQRHGAGEGEADCFR